MASLNQNNNETCGLAIQQGVATLTLQRPEVLNAFNRTQRVEMVQALREVAQDDSVRVLVITGQGKAFCAGQDQNESAAMDAAASADRIDEFMALYREIRGLRKPIIARLNGVAAGSGLQIALLADLRIAAESARIGMTELNVGSTPITGSALLWEIAGQAATKRLILLSEIVSAGEALALNIVHEVVPDAALDTRIAEITARIKRWEPTTVALTKAWWESMDDDLFERMAATARSAHAENFASGAYSAGAKRFKTRSAGGTSD
ncbi:enoyl-CoA hydratase/isomerase family protein [Verticiella sediminum]|uniref:Enoyl-CoA hydratase/isomerase family protein n=1 Tax=Verticiella sediminum TaxID=1247510 RepID=A0A556A871_9BURK|nr:enoyl-CoA hydratase/isomerase family protein [Verticiella sediminum]TSH89094.1 enoyl-CoA hydratase/isomerase family protein [Verticiella sediminum]